MNAYSIWYENIVTKSIALIFASRLTLNLDKAIFLHNLGYLTLWLGVKATANNKMFFCSSVGHVPPLGILRKEIAGEGCFQDSIGDSSPWTLVG